MKPQPVEINGVTYASMRAAQRATGIAKDHLRLILNPHHVRKKRREWYGKNRDKQREDKRRWSGKPAPTRPCPLTCEVCEQSPGKRSLHLDHDHETEAFRGWLCSNCNTGIGLFRDNPRLLRRAARYLVEHLV